MRSNDGRNERLIPVKTEIFVKAVLTNDGKSVAEMIKMDPEIVNCKDRDGITPLMTASESGLLEIARTLLSKKAAVNAVDGYGRNALFYAVECEETDIIRLLVLNGSRIDITDSFGTTVFNMASSSRNKLINELLQEAYTEKSRAIKKILNGKGYSTDRESLLKALKADDREAVDLLLDSDPNCEFLVAGFFGAFVSPLMYCVETGAQKAAESLIKKGAAVDGRDHYGMTALMRAAEIGNAGFCGFLIDNGADFDLRDDFGSTALITAAMKKHSAVVETLAARGAFPDAANNDGMAAIHYSILNRDMASVEALLETGAFADLPNARMETPLVMALKTGDLKIVEAVLKRAGNLAVKNIHGFNALMLSCDNGFDEISVKLIEKILKIV